MTVRIHYREKANGGLSAPAWVDVEVVELTKDSVMTYTEVLRPAWEQSDESANS